MTAPNRHADRLVIFGCNGFIAGHLLKAAEAAAIPTAGVSHRADPSEILKAGDVVVNCALHPDLRSGPYRADFDLDLHIAEAAHRCGAHFAMLSSRRVYPVEVRWGAREDGPAGGDETTYGRNKALSEAAVRAASGGAATILRLSNIIGYEYSPGGQRRSFMAQMLRTLHANQTIHFDMSPTTRRDFLSVEACAELVLKVALGRFEGAWNVGAGFPSACGELAEWIMFGFQGGRLIAASDEIRDEFYLDMGKWRSIFTPPTTQESLRRYCMQLGQELRNA